MTAKRIWGSIAAAMILLAATGATALNGASGLLSQGRGTLPGGADGGAPLYFNYQGLLLDSAGNPVADDNYQLTFAIYGKKPESPAACGGGERPGERSLRRKVGHAGFFLGSSPANNC